MSQAIDHLTPMLQRSQTPPQPAATRSLWVTLLLLRSSSNLCLTRVFFLQPVLFIQRVFTLQICMHCLLIKSANRYFFLAVFLLRGSLSFTPVLHLHGLFNLMLNECFTFPLPLSPSLPFSWEYPVIALDGRKFCGLLLPFPLVYFS